MRILWPSNTGGTGRTSEAFIASARSGISGYVVLRTLKIKSLDQMEISRHGSGAYHGEKSIELKNGSISWNSSSVCIELTKRAIRDFNGRATHDYTVSIPLDELVSMLAKVLAQLETNAGDVIVAKLSTQAVQLQRLISTMTRPYTVPPAE